MKVTLNLHPADGVQPHEEAYANMCQAMGRDADKKLAIDFDPTDERFMQAYFTCLHHPLEAEGVDFWWIDCSKGQPAPFPGWTRSGCSMRAITAILPGTASAA